MATALQAAVSAPRACLGPREGGAGLRLKPAAALQGQRRQRVGLATRAARVVCSAAAADNFGASQPEDPYKVLGLTPLDSFEAVKVAHRKKKKEAEAKGDEATLEKLEKAYDSIMMLQLNRRKQGVTFGSLKVSSEIKYADAYDFLPWRPRYERSDKKGIYLNAAVSALMALWSVAAQDTNWKALQILTAYYVFTLFVKLDPFYPASAEDGEKRWQRNGRRLTRALGLVFGCVAVAAVVHSAAYYAYALLGFYVPRALTTFQELFITLACSAGLFLIGSYYR